MSLTISTRYAVRSLLRQRRRTLLSVVGVAVGCASCLVTISFVRGEGELIIRAAAESGTGHLRIAPLGWAKRRENDLRLVSWRAELARVGATAGVKVATPRARANGLLAAGTRVVGTEIAGVRPATEQASNRLVRDVTAGRYLAPGDAGSAVIAAVVGKAIVDRLDVELDDEVMLTMSDAEGEMRSEMLRVVGVVATGSREIDATICHVPLGDLVRLNGRPGAGEIAILLEDYRRIGRVRRELAGAGAGGNEVLTWGEVSPELRDGLQIDRSFSQITVGLVVVLVLLGITSAQLTAVLERRREFAVLAALGMKTRQVVRLMAAEAVIFGVAGAAVGLVLASPALYLMAEYGIDMRWFTGEGDLTMSGALLEPILYGDVGAWLVPYALMVSLSATLLASVYPAWYAARTDPASALRVA